MSEIPGLNAAWSWIMTKCPNERLLFTIGSCIMHSLSFWGLNGLLYLVYTRNWFPQYKIQPPQKFPDAKLIKDCLVERVFGHFVIGPIGSWYLYGAFKHFGMSTGPLPSVLTFAWQFVVFFLINDALFYWAHRLLHHPRIYGYIHKKHHMFKTSIGIAAEYAHPVEDILANAFPTIAGPLFMDCHMAVFFVYMAIRIWETVDAHSGYRFPWSPWHQITFIQGGPDRHDWHHSHGHKQGNYGMLRFWDWICGTDKAYNDWVAKGRPYELVAETAGAKTD